MIETPTMELRWTESFDVDDMTLTGKNCYSSDRQYKLQQKWIITNQSETYIVWKDIKVNYD